MIKSTKITPPSAPSKGIRCLLRERLRKEGVKGDFEIKENSDGSLQVLGVSPLSLVLFKERKVSYVPFEGQPEQASALDVSLDIPADAFVLEDLVSSDEEQCFEEFDNIEENCA